MRYYLPVRCSRRQTALDAGLFPLSASADGRYLIDGTGNPFPIVGRSLWELVSLTSSERATAVNDTATRGYTAIEMRAPSRLASAPNAPFDGAGNLPFTKRLDGNTYTGSLSYSNINNEAPDFTFPNETYWAYLDAIFAACESAGLAVCYFPAYLGFDGGNQGWMQELKANGSTKTQTYGAWVTNRYKNQKNLIWCIAGDYNMNHAGDQAIAEALLAGMQSTTGQRSTLISAEGNDPSISSDLPGTSGAAITLNGAYSFSGDVNTYARNGYAHSPTLPTFLIEEPYDQQGPDGTGVNANATQPCRRFQWWGWLSAIGGAMHGNGYVIHFDGGGVWQAHLNTQTTNDMTRQATFMRSIPWYQLVPNGLGSIGTLVTAGGGTLGSSDYVAAAATPIGAWLVAYVPPAHSGSVTIDMSKMRGSTRSRWFDPTNGNYTADATGLANSGTHAFTTPGNNSAGDADWTLVLDA